MFYPFLLIGYGSVAIFVLRVALGAIFIVHGWPKVSNLKKNAGVFDGMGFKPGAFWGTLAALLEFFGGIAFVLGLFVGSLAFLYAVQFAVILVWRIARGDKFWDGWEFDLLIFAALLLFIGTGAGYFTFGHLFGGYR
jgi:putative oxidoreductase